MVKITDEDSLREWLKDRLREDAVFIASRAAMRVFPVYWGQVLSHSDENPSLIAIPFLRCLLISSLAAKMPRDEIRAVADSAIKAAATVNVSGAGFGGLVIQDVLTAILVVTIDNASDAASTRSVNFGNMWEIIQSDAAFLEQRGGDALPGLWGDVEWPSASQWQDIKVQLSGQAGWNFWLDWYQRILDGGAFPEDYLNLLKDIATRDEVFWGGNDDAVNGRIAALYEAYERNRLLQEVRDLKAALVEARRTQSVSPAIGHNNPPEEIDSPESFTSSIEIVWPIVKVAEKELEKSEPDKSRLRKIGEGLLQWAKSVTAYCGKVGDTIISAAATRIGKGIAVYLLAQWITNGRALELAEDLIKYAIGM